jgi:hypothetical protein
MSEGVPPIQVTPLRRIGRGLLRRCARCGRAGIFASYFRLRERCPSCGYRFAPDEGFFLGVFVFNFAIIEALLFVGLMAYILAMGTTGGTVPVLPVLAVGIAFAIGAPIVFYPFAASIWAAIELAMHPPSATDEPGGLDKR